MGRCMPACATGSRTTISIRLAPSSRRRSPRICRVSKLPYDAFNCGLKKTRSAAAASRAAQLAYSEMDAPRRGAWAAISYSVSVELAAAEEWEERISAAQVVVEDAGFTEVVRYGDRHRSLALMLAHPH